jgi:hypothetical protein
MHPGHDRMVVGFTTTCAIQGRIQDFKSGGGAHLKKNHDFMPKNHIFSNFRGGCVPGGPPWIRPCNQYLSPLKL